MVSYNVQEDKLVCSFPERLDTEKCLDLENELHQKVKELKMPVIFDLNGVTYISSMFLRICIQTLKGVGPENFSLINLNPNVKKVLKIAGLDKVITIK